VSGTPYIDADTLDQCFEAIRQGATITTLAGQLSCSPEHLARLLDLPQWKQVPASETNPDEFDLFAADRLEGML
jgi:hypothetical protein